jgi:hypothetical protein
MRLCRRKIYVDSEAFGCAVSKIFGGLRRSTLGKKGSDSSVIFLRDLSSTLTFRDKFKISFFDALMTSYCWTNLCEKSRIFENVQHAARREIEFNFTARR